MQDLLIQLLREFCDENSLPFLSADELLVELEDLPMPPGGRKLAKEWLETYSSLWELTVT